MGKSNRIRANKAIQAAKAPGVKKTKKGMPSWLMTLITLVITAAVLLTVVAGLLSANGVFNRMRVSLSSDNYKINTNMMSYYFYTQYQSFQTDYESYIDYLSLDTSKSLKEQTFGGDGTNTNYDATFLGAFEGTWFDYFMNQTVESAKGVLIYCEEANARGITLNEDELGEIDKSIDSIRTTATMYGYNLNTYIASMYGPGVKETDVRRAMEYSALATKCMNTVLDELEVAIGEDRINTKYDSAKLDFNVVDYTTYTFTIDYSDIATEVLGSDYTDSDLKAKEAEVLAAYKEAITEAKTKAEAMKGAATAENFLKMIYETVAEESFETIYTAQTIEDADKPSDEDFNAIKTAMLADLVAELLEGKNKADDAVTIEEGKDSVTAYEKTVTAIYAKTLNTVKTKVFEAVLEEKATALQDKVNYTKDDDFSEWAFADGRVAGEKTVIVDGDGSAEGDITKENGYSYISAYYLRSAQYRDTEKTRDVAYMIFSTEEDAKNAITGLAANTSLDLTAFEAYADANGASGHTHLEDCTRGFVGSDAFDEWLFNETTTLGMVSATPIELDSSNYAVAYYYGEGDEHWHVTVKDTILSEDFEAYYTAMEGKYAIKTNEKALQKVEA